VVDYASVIEGRAEVGRRVAIIGAGGIGFDVAMLLSATSAPDDPIAAFAAHWGIDTTLTSPGGLQAAPAAPSACDREIILLQRKTTRIGEGLGRTTGWIHRAELKERGVRFQNGVQYDRFDADGLHITVDGVSQCLAVDTVVICAGQEPVRPGAFANAHAIIGGARLAAELDAVRAIREGAEWAAAL
jgi:2,4-dienoyl-CoA reductase (NADPH2)